MTRYLVTVDGDELRVEASTAEDAAEEALRRCDEFGALADRGPGDRVPVTVVDPAGQRWDYDGSAERVTEYSVRLTGGGVPISCLGGTTEEET